MTSTHGANKLNLSAQRFNPYEVTLPEFAEINDGIYLLMCTRPLEAVKTSFKKRSICALIFRIQNL